MKKVIAILLVIVIVFALAGCDSFPKEPDYGLTWSEVDFEGITLLIPDEWTLAYHDDATVAFTMEGDKMFPLLMLRRTEQLAVEDQGMDAINLEAFAWSQLEGFNAISKTVKLDRRFGAHDIQGYRMDFEGRNDVNGVDTYYTLFFTIIDEAFILCYYSIEVERQDVYSDEINKVFNSIKSLAK